MLVRIGRSRNRPAPAVPVELKKEMPRRSCGRKPLVKVRVREGMVAWMGRADVLVLVLGGVLRGCFQGGKVGKVWGGNGFLTSLIRWSWMYF